MKHKIENSITTERVRILYDNLSKQNIVTIVAVLIISYVFRQQFSTTQIFVWCGYMVIGVGLRFWCLFNFRKNSENIYDHNKFETQFTYASGVVSLGWAIFIVASLSLPSFIYRIYSVLLLTSLIGASVPVLMSSLKTLYVYILPPIMVAIPMLFIRGGADGATGLAVLIYSMILIRSGKYINHTLVHSITEHLYNQNLVKELEQSRNDKSETENRMQSIMDYAPAAIYVKDVDGRFTFLNQKVADLHHKRREDIIGEILYDIFPDDIADEERKNDFDVINTAKPREYEESVLEDDGVHRYFSIKFPLFDEAGNVNELGVVSTDITERFRIEESLKISQQRLLLHREQSPLGIIEWNTDFEIMDWNPSAERIFGYMKDEVMGRRISEKIVHGNDQEPVNEVWRELLANEGGTHNINENITKDGRRILCEWHNTPLVDSNGNVIGVTSLVDDITERQKLEDSLHQSQKMDAIGKLTGGIAHDFNNMLGVILGFSELIKERMSTDDSKLIKYNNEIINAADRARKLTSQLLEFSRKAPSSAESTAIDILLYGMRHMLERTLTPRINLVFELSENLWSIWIDKTRLEDAILNICINSMHAMPNGGTLSIIACNMHVTDSDTQDAAITSGDYVLLSVSDTGMGMSHEIQNKIFDPFFTTKGSEGTGLGMSQVYGFIQQCGGNIQVFSELGQGTRVDLYFPRYQGSETVIAEGHSTDLVKLASGHETILVVEDEFALLDLAENILSTYGYTVLRAESAEQALKVLETNYIDLMLSDVIMPGMNGYQLAAEVGKHYPNIKIQMVSGFSDEQNTNLVNETLHQQRLHKPFNSKELLRRIRQLLDEDR
ncbi:MAG: PAS domain S-box protein [Gammaproteobacteria bacterium]